MEEQHANDEAHSNSIQAISERTEQEEPDTTAEESHEASDGSQDREEAEQDAAAAGKKPTKCTRLDQRRKRPNRSTIHMMIQVQSNRSTKVRQ